MSRIFPVMLLLKLSQFSTSLRRLDSGLFPVRYLSKIHSSGGGRKIIDVDVVDDQNKPVKRSNNKKVESKDSNTSIFGGLVSRVQGIFGLDEATKRKREQKKMINNSIDKMLQGSGPLGTVVGGVVKMVAGMMSDAFAESANDMNAVVTAIESSLDDSGDAYDILGLNIRCGTPFSTSMSSMSINGVMTKNMNLILPVSGSKSQGQVQVASTIDNTGNVFISQLILTSTSGQVITIKGNNSGDGGGRRRGGGGGGGQVIDVETV